MKNVFVQYRILANLTVTAYQIITLDMTPPVARAGQNQTVIVGTSVSFNGGNSTDNNAILAYLWDFGDGTNGTGVTPVHTYSAVDNYTVKLTVKDAAGTTATSSSVVSFSVVIPEFQSGALLILLVIVALTFAWAGPKKGKLGR